MTNRTLHYPVIIDGAAKGFAFYRNRRWWWERRFGSIDPMPPGCSREDVLAWAKKCCNGTTACFGPVEVRS